MIDVESLLKSKEGENIEFKEAKEKFEFDELAKYACALSNQGGGSIVLGVTDKRPRMIVGTKAFAQPEETRRSLISKLHVNVDFEEVESKDGKRVLVFTVPPHPIGQVIQYDKDGIAWCRIADSIVRMPDDVRRRLYAEGGDDFSAKICVGATVDDLDDVAIEVFRNKWYDRCKKHSVMSLSKTQLLRDCEAMVGDEVTYAALILFGKHSSLSKFLGCSEVVYEFRQTNAPGRADARENFREAFFNIYDDLWNLVNARNTQHHYQDGFFLLDVDRFNEQATREAILNAISHRNYQQPGSVFVVQYPDRLVVSSPGGFLPGITPENCHARQATRNRRIAEILALSGLVERAGQGMDLIVSNSIREGKGLPTWNGTDDYEVKMTLNGLVLDNDVVKSMKKIGEETLQTFSTLDFITIDAVLRNLPISRDLRECAKKLVELGFIEKIGRNQYVMSRKYYSAKGKAGEHTRKIGLDKETNKELILKHVRAQKDLGGKMSEFLQVLPMLSRRQIQELLNELVEENRIQKKGTTSRCRWFAL